MKKQLFSYSVLCSLLAFSLLSCSKQGANPVTDATTAANTPGTAGSARVAATYSLNNWMCAIANTVKLAALIIPGSHDAYARVEPISGNDKFQNLSLTDQLNSGIRFSDIRCRH